MRIGKESALLLFSLTLLAQQSPTQRVPEQQPPKQLVLVLVGPPGSGKSTQASVLTRKLKLPIVAIDDLRKVQGNVDDALKARTRQPDAAGGFILDGYPSTRMQADFLNALVHELNLPKPLIVQLDVSDETVRQRLAKSNRPQDSPANLERRLAEYHKELDLFRSYYPQDDIWTINGSRTPAEVTETILMLLADRQ
jgi:adenylate kinase